MNFSTASIDELKDAVVELWTMLDHFDRYDQAEPGYIGSPFYKQVGKTLANYRCEVCGGQGWVLVGFEPPFDRESCGACGPPFVY